jgi:hypothetical protein
MKKKPPVPPNPKAAPRTYERSWHNGGDIEIAFYARSVHDAAQKLIATLDLKPNPKTAWDAGPVILLYRQAVELRLKSLVGEGSNFLQSPTESLSLAKTHSLRWLAQIACQIIRAVRWENEFKREGISSLADFSALVDELESLDPVAVAMRPGNRRPDFSVPQQLLPSNVVRFAERLDALLDLLVATADGLAAEWDLQRDGISTEADLDGSGDFTPTIQ